MQSTYDPREIKRLIPGDAYKHPALVPFFARPEGWDWDTDEIDEALALADVYRFCHHIVDPAMVNVIAALNPISRNVPVLVHRPDSGSSIDQIMDVDMVNLVMPRFIVKLHPSPVRAENLNSVPLDTRDAKMLAVNDTDASLVPSGVNLNQPTVISDDDGSSIGSDDIREFHYAVICSYLIRFGTGINASL